MPDNAPSLPHDIRRVIINLTANFIPMDETFYIEGFNQHILRDCGRLFAAFSPFNRRLLVWGLRFFEWFPFLFGFGFIPYSRIAPKHQLRYLKNWEASAAGWRRQFFAVIRGLILMIACTHPEIWRTIGYDPEPYMRERIELRRRLVSM